MDIQRLKDGIIDLSKRNGHNSDNKKEADNRTSIDDLEESLYQIQESMKIENGYNNIIKQIEIFMNKVRDISAQENEDRLFLREEKASLIAAAKQLQKTINNRSLA